MKEDNDPSLRQGSKWGWLIFILGWIILGLLFWGKAGNTPQIALWIANLPLRLTLLLVGIMLYVGSFWAEGIIGSCKSQVN